MRFAQPHWLLIGLVTVTLLTVLLARSERLKARAVALLERARLRSASAAPSRGRRAMRVLVTTLAVACAFLALARPQKGTRWETLERNGIDLLLVVDTSKSMDSDDIKPTRLERSKLAIRDLVERFPGDRIGLVAFAGDAFVQSPMTLDHGALLESVDALDTQTIARGGTDIGRGIDVATTALASEPARQKVMVLLTDGEDLEGHGLDEAKAAAAAGITIDTIGVGTQAGELVPTRDARGVTTGVALDGAGKPVRSRLDEAGLKAIAEATRGAYRPLGVDGRGLDALYDASLAPLTHAEASSQTRRVYTEWFELPLALALLGLVIDSLLGRRWQGFAKHVRRQRAGASRAVAVAAAIALVALPTAAHASVATAAKSYAAGHFDEAAKEFERESAKAPNDARLAFNAGDSAFRAGHFEAADVAFKRALGSADPKLQQRVLYNEGDTLFRLGEAMKPEARDEKIAQWKSAIEAYDGALALDAHDGDALFNRDLVKRRLKALEEEKKPEPKPDASKPDAKDKSGGGGSDPKQGAGEGDKDGHGGASGSKPSPRGKSGDEPKSKGDPSTAAKGDAREARGDGKKGGDKDGEDKGSGTPGKLSARDARALLGALRGDERRGARHATGAAASTDDAPGKDW